MDVVVVHNVENVEWLNLKVTSVKPLEGNPSSALSITPNNVIFQEDVGSCLKNKFETLGSELIRKDMELIFNHDMSVKLDFEGLKDLDLVKYYFYLDLDNIEWTQTILSRIHNGKFWMGDNVVEISTNLIHEVTGICKQGSISVGEKLVKKKVEQNTKAVYNGKAMVISTIKQHDVRFMSRVIASSIYASSKTDELSTGFIYMAYKICIEKE